MAPISDRTLAERLAGRLRAAGVFALFIRKLGPDQPLFLAATGFDAHGAQRRVTGTAATLEAALLQLLAELDRDDRRPAPTAEPLQRKRRSNVRRPSVDELERNSGRPLNRPERLRRIALTRARTLGAITVAALVGAAGLMPTTAAEEDAVEALRGMVVAGELRESRRFGYVARGGTLDNETREEDS